MKRWYLLPLLLVFVLACTISTAPEAATPVQPQVIVVTATPMPATATPYPTYTPFPTPTEIPATPTPYPTYTPYPSPTAVQGQSSPAPAGAPTVTVSVDTQCRIGPGQKYIQLSGLVVGKVGKVVGKSADGLYWIIKNPTDIGVCWLWGEYATVTGDVSALKVYEEPTWLKDYAFKLVVSTVPDTVNIGRCYYQAHLIDWPVGMVVTFSARQRVAGEWVDLTTPKDITLGSRDGFIGPGSSIKIKGDMVLTVITTKVNGEKTMVGMSLDDNNCQ